MKQKIIYEGFVSVLKDIEKTCRTVIDENNNQLNEMSQGKYGDINNVHAISCIDANVKQIKVSKETLYYLDKLKNNIEILLDQ